MPALHYRGQRDRVLDALTRKYQSTNALREVTGLLPHQLAVALVRLRKDGLVETRTAKPKEGGYHYREHRLTGKRPEVAPIKTHNERSDYWTHRSRSEPAKIRAGSDNERVLKSLSNTAMSSQALSKRLKLTVAQVRNAVSYLRARGYPIAVTYETAESGQPVAQYALTDESVKPQTKRRRAA